jgi:predicted DNA-binding transcriptional regulator AlpA
VPSIELKDFDRLPDAAHVDVNTVAALFGCAVPTVWLRVRRKVLPTPRKFGSHTRWNVGELRKLLQGAPA